MKKKIAIILVGIMCMGTAGCSLFGNSDGIDMSAINTADIFGGISDDDIIEASAAKEAFDTAMGQVENDENITINVNNSIVMGEKGEDDYQDSVSSTNVKISIVDDNPAGSVVIENKYGYTDEDGKAAEDEYNISGSYMDGALYFTTNDGDNVREEMGFEDFLYVVDTYTLNIYEESVSKAAAVEDKDGITTYYISYDPESFEQTMNTNLEASGQSMADGEYMDIDYANIIAEIDADGNLLGYGFVIEAAYVTDESTVPYNYSIEVTFGERGTTQVDTIENTDDYMSADEYTAMMQGGTDDADASEDEAAADEDADGVDVDSDSIENSDNIDE